MGASYNLDLTTNSTHLLVGNIDTPKYKFVAKERPDMKVLKPEWIEAVRSVWVAGDDVDVAALEEQYRMPTFAGVKICLTGFKGATRITLQETVARHGAHYSGDLDRTVTHLVAAKTNGPKYAAAKQWNLKTVSLRWVQESIERGLALEETLYDPLIPEEEQGEGACSRALKPTASLEKRNRGDAQTDGTFDVNRKKLRRSASTKLGGESQTLWADISALGARSRALDGNSWVDGEDSALLPADDGGGLVGADSAQQDIRRAPGQPGRTLDPDVRPTEIANRAKSLFQNWHICVQGFNKERVCDHSKRALPLEASILTLSRQLYCTEPLAKMELTFFIIREISAPRMTGSILQV
ncbi:protein kinase activating protein dpb11 [Elasticomyces elasticus]|nr:protein kinase activating protein dpb11 [Elasticomyces elasticus]